MKKFLILATTILAALLSVSCEKDNAEGDFTAEGYHLYCLEGFDYLDWEYETSSSEFHTARGVEYTLTAKTENDAGALTPVDASTHKFSIKVLEGQDKLTDLYAKSKDSAAVCGFTTVEPGKAVIRIILKKKGAVVLRRTLTLDIDKVLG